MTDACPACAAAETNPYAGLTSAGFHEGKLTAGCIGCAVRYTSLQPRAKRDLILSGIADPASRERFLADCVAEYHRREALKAGRPLQ